MSTSCRGVQGARSRDMASVSQRPGLIKSLAVCVALSGPAAVWPQSTPTPAQIRANAVLRAFVSGNLSSLPPNVGAGSGGPMMMLVASKDHTLFAPIYTDFEDVDGDGVLDFTFKPTFSYYGYFDPTKCYAYVTGRSSNKLARFEPQGMADSSMRCNTVTDGTGSRTTSYWSGNFLNWATMTRIDVVRKLLYGGYRVEDDANDTTLQMAQMSFDAHSFVKYYSGSDIGYYTPFSDADLSSRGLTICSRGSTSGQANPGDGSYPLMRLAMGNYSLWGTIGGDVCRWSSESGDKKFGQKAQAFFSQYGTEGDGSALLASHGLMAAVPANVSIGSVPSELAIRVQACSQNTALHGNERCASYGSNSVVYKPIGLLQKFGASTDNTTAAKAEFGLITGRYAAPMNAGALRKNVGMINDELNLNNGTFCYTASNPSASCVTGIIAAMDRIRLVDAGNYEARGTRYVLPENLGAAQYPSWGNPISEMVVQALTYLGGYQSSTVGAAGDLDATLGMPFPTPVDPLLDTVASNSSTKSGRYNLFGHGVCRKQNLLVISSGSATFDTYNSNGDNYASFDSMVSAAASNTALCGGQACPTATSASRIELWTDRLGGIEGINGTLRSVGSVTGDFGADCSVKTVGGGASTVSGYGKGLSAVSGLCPDVPGIKGSYLGAGAAFFANTTNLRDSLTAQTGDGVDKRELPAGALRVKTYAASLAGGVARVEVPLPTNTSTPTRGVTFAPNNVIITPESTWRHGGAGTNVGAMLTFRAIGTEAPFATRSAGASGLLFGGSGSYVVTWNDTQFGGDYDMDIVGFLRWELVRAAATDTTWTVNIYTDILNVNAGATGTHGFSIIGTDATPGTGFNVDGRFLTHSANGTITGTLCDGYGADEKTYKCTFRNGPDGEQLWPLQVTAGYLNFLTATNSLTSTTQLQFKASVGTRRNDSVLRDPLWYMAKYGSFETKDEALTVSSAADWTSKRKATAAQPDAPSTTAATNWDSEKNDPNAACVGRTSCTTDGEPDGYFLARRPDLLEKRLDDLLTRVTNGNNSAVATSTSQLSTGEYKYVATFESSDTAWSGNLRGYPLLASGSFSTTASWEASLTMAASSGRNGLTGSRARQVITNDLDASNQQVGAPLIAVERVAASGSTAAVNGLSKAYFAQLTGIAEASVQASDAADLIAFVRGSDAQEGVGRKFRDRGTDEVMGPLVTSSPWLQNPNAAARFTDASLAQGSPSYRTFVENRRGQNKVLWVGSHDGMVHGLEATTGTPMLSYVPSPVVSRLAAQASLNAPAKAPLVDGGVYTADVLVGRGAANTKSWATYLFGSLGRGGKAVFALDVTNPGTTTATTGTGSGRLSEGNATSLFKWIFTDGDDGAGAGDLGYTVSAPMRHVGSGQAQQVVRLNNNRFAVLVPNGYGSTNGRAYLYILYVEGPGSTGWGSAGGGNFEKLAAGTNTGNGLMGVNWVDLDNNGTADVVYATDLLGQVWKFDIRSSNPQNWGSAFKRNGNDVPFFQAVGCDRDVSTGAVANPPCNHALTITTNPTLVRPNFGGVLVGFGTGKAILSSDYPNATKTNRFITVWDRGRYAEDQIFTWPTGVSTSTQPTLPSINTTGNALPARFLRVKLAVDASGNAYRVRTDSNGNEVPLPPSATPDAFNAQTQDGWYIDFPSVGEQLISTPSAFQDFITFTAVRPVDSSDRERTCSTSSRGRFYAFDLRTGITPRAFLGFSTDATANGAAIYGLDVAEQQITTVGASDTIGTSRCASGQRKGKLIGAKVTDKDGCIDAGQLRLQWREIPGLRTQ